MAEGVIGDAITSPDVNDKVNVVEVTDTKVIGTSVIDRVQSDLLSIVNKRFVDSSNFNVELSCGSIHIIGFKSEGVNVWLYN